MYIFHHLHTMQYSFSVMQFNQSNAVYLREQSKRANTITRYSQLWLNWKVNQ